MKSALTKIAEHRIMGFFNDKFNRGLVVVLECPIGIGFEDNNTGIVDAIFYNHTKNDITCFEIKVSVADFHSKAKKTFVGHKNYYVMPMELFEKVKDEIPKNIGCYTFDPNKNYGDGYLRCAKKCVHQELKVNKELLLSSMLRSARNKTNLRVIKELYH